MLEFLNNPSPDQVVRDQIAKCEAVREAGGDKYYWALVAEFCRQNIWFLIRHVLGWAWLDEDLHARQLLSFYETNRDADTAVFIPRGFGKTLLTAGRIIHGYTLDKDAAYLFASATEDFANDFGNFVSGIMLGNTKLHQAFPEVFPSTTSGLSRWGKNGYDLPLRSGRLDPSLLCLSLKSNTTGKHPDIAFVDDLITRRNNTPKAYSEAELLLKELRVMLPAHGVIHLTGTRWHDADPYGKILTGKIAGKRGAFRNLVMSAWENDNPVQPCIWPKKKRWTWPRESGYSNEELDAMRRPEHEGGLGSFFDAQMRNDPAPEERQDVKLSYVNRFEAKDTPKVSYVKLVGVEVTGGGRLIYTTLQEKLEKLRIRMPLAEMSSARKQGETKADKIKAVLEPIVSQGRLYIQEWMAGVNGTDQSTLGYEIKRLGSASHDDIVDALHCIPLHLSRGILPLDGEAAHLYIACDLAWTEEKRADYCVLLAAALDAKGNLWVLDYDRFQSSAPTAIADRIIEFYQKWTDDKQAQRRPRFRFAMSYR